MTTFEHVIEANIDARSNTAVKQWGRISFESILSETVCLLANVNRE